MMIMVIIIIIIIKIEPECAYRSLSEIFRCLYVLYGSLSSSLMLRLSLSLAQNRLREIT